MEATANTGESKSAGSDAGTVFVCDRRCGKEGRAGKRRKGERMMDVYGLGTLAIDVLMKVDKLPAADGFCIVKSNERQPGGSGTNVIVQLARLGAKCGFAGGVGDDGLGKDVLDSLRQEKVSTDQMKVIPGKITLHTDIVIDDAGDKFIMLNMGDAFDAFRAEDVNPEEIAGAKIFYTDLLPYSPAVSALKAAREHGVRTVFNMQVGLGTMEGMGISRKDVLAALEYVDVFAPCQEGLYGLTGTRDLDECTAFLRRYCKGVLLFTLGKKGSVAYDEQDNRFSADCITVEAVDTTGAGDSYMGSFIFAYYLRKYDLEKAMRFASVCAGYTCTGLGARFSPDIETADQLFQRDIMRQYS